MKRLVACLFTLALVAPLAPAHFIWIVPQKDADSAQVVFSDSLQPDDAKYLEKIARSEVFGLTADGKTVPIKWTLGKEAYDVKLADKQEAIGLVCNYGVVAKGKTDPFLLHYYAKYTTRSSGIAFKMWDKMPLEIVWRASKLGVLWQGKPLPEAEVTVLAPDEKDSTSIKADKEGILEPNLAKEGIYGFRVRHVEAKEGEQNDKKYKEIRHYATLVLKAARKEGAAAPAKAELKAAPAKVELKADPAATKLLADARAARATWKDFPGFSADIEVNFDGKVARGQVTVDAKGKLTFTGLSGAHETWAERNLSSLVNHRLDSGRTEETPCAFADDNKDHPLGREIRVLNDELHSGYRIKDNQIVVVMRQVKDRRFNITVLDQKVNAEGKFLSSTFVVDYWNLKSGELVRSEGNLQTWTRVGKFDLPIISRVTKSSKEQPRTEKPTEDDNPYTTQELKLTNHKLLK